MNGENRTGTGLDPLMPALIVTTLRGLPRSVKPYRRQVRAADRTGSGLVHFFEGATSQKVRSRHQVGRTGNHHMDIPRRF